jgi:hypothetical protein
MSVSSFIFSMSQHNCFIEQGTSGSELVRDVTGLKNEEAQIDRAYVKRTKTCLVFRPTFCLCSQIGRTPEKKLKNLGEFTAKH